MKDLNTVWGASDLVTSGIAYTVMGILIVFLILVIIMMVIKALPPFIAVVDKVVGIVKAFFAKIKASIKGNKGKQTSLAESAPVQVVTETVPETAPETDDLELVAVITAAIAAMTGESTSDFVVRSYKKVPGGSWNKAGRMEVLDNRL